MRPIKFDLPLNGTRIATLEQLGENLTPEILEPFRSGKLAKWLRARSLDEQAGAVEALLAGDNEHEVQLLKGLYGVFGGETDHDLLQVAIAERKRSLPSSHESCDMELEAVKAAFEKEIEQLNRDGFNQQPVQRPNQVRIDAQLGAKYRWPDGNVQRPNQVRVDAQGRMWNMYNQEVDRYGNLIQQQISPQPIQQQQPQNQLRVDAQGRMWNYLGQEVDRYGNLIQQQISPQPIQQQQPQNQLRVDAQGRMWNMYNQEVDRFGQLIVEPLTPNRESEMDRSKHAIRMREMYEQMQRSIDGFAKEQIEPVELIPSSERVVVLDENGFGKLDDNGELLLERTPSVMKPPCK
jgi:hypothetical protein